MEQFHSPPHLGGPLDLTDTSILVTGGTGSFGKAFIRHLLDQTRVRRIAVYSRDEHKQSDLALALNAADHERVRFFIGDIRDLDRLSMAMKNVDYVVHAAAMKIVPAAEYNPFECIQTNIIGAENVVRASLQHSVKRIIALSTDKAASPINLYGATKLASDKIFVAANHLAGGDGGRFSVVRYGNVMASRGSVLPFFRKLIAQGAVDLPITDERMTRFCITLGQGVSFVLSSLAMMRGGEIFVPKIPSIRVVDLAHNLAPNLPLRMVGIRPGEKLHEMMITTDDARTTVELDDRYIIEPAIHLWDRQRSSLLEETGTRKVAEDFHYSSDINTHWLTGRDLSEFIAAGEADARI
ncbi:MAG: UDP-N-acetylglucosamine 4,6-dehydratase (inverting) [Ferrovibrio sp.]|nr:UDP-N-acetylglucosamine 4,6-dehydratase (inverting) [Ferrovibrio sp.]MCW0234945.1 UDP-N-acetylglucosamine 4,6-dehydratase (inverting) [Ferrovibrio sp.]